MTQWQPHDHKFMLMEVPRKGFVFSPLINNRDLHNIEPNYNIAANIKINDFCVIRNKTVYGSFLKEAHFEKVDYLS